jgi:C-terminal processing protease CtpA/Prc
LRSGTISEVVDKAKQLPDGDVLVVGPLPSEGTASDGEILADTAKSLGTFVGAKNSGGVISVS